MFFHGWEPLIRIVVAACIAYVGLLCFIRISGKRTLSQLNAFDFVVSVAFGSTLATVILSKSVALLEGLLGLLMLILLQYAVSWTTSRFRWASAWVKAEPRLVFHNGRYLDRVMKAERVEREELLQVLRSQGISSLEDVLAIVMETNGKFSVLKQGSKEPSTLEDVAGP